MSEEEDLADEIIGPMPLVGRDEPKEVCMTCYEWTRQQIKVSTSCFDAECSQLISQTLSEYSR